MLSHFQSFSLMESLKDIKLNSKLLRWQAMFLIVISLKSTKTGMQIQCNFSMPLQCANSTNTLVQLQTTYQIFHATWTSWCCGLIVTKRVRIFVLKFWTFVRKIFPALPKECKEFSGLNSHRLLQKTCSKHTSNCTTGQALTNLFLLM